jgi:hypothetical protein
VTGLYKYDARTGRYTLPVQIVYRSKRYGGRTITVPIGYKSDGASGPAEDLYSEAFWVHDVICGRWTFDDGTPITTTMASTILSDILKSEGRWFRARSWWIATRLFGPRSPWG